MLNGEDDSKENVRTFQKEGTVLHRTVGSLKIFKQICDLKKNDFSKKEAQQSSALDRGALDIIDRLQ